jgi:hypothetical protein
MTFINMMYGPDGGYEPVPSRQKDRPLSARQRPFFG